MITSCFQMSRNRLNRYHRQLYVNGTVCDITNKPRRAEVRVSHIHQIWWNSREICADHTLDYNLCDSPARFLAIFHGSLLGLGFSMWTQNSTIISRNTSWIFILIFGMTIRMNVVLLVICYWSGQSVPCHQYTHLACCHISQAIMFSVDPSTN